MNEIGWGVLGLLVLLLGGGQVWIARDLRHLTADLDRMLGVAEAVAGQNDRQTTITAVTLQAAVPTGADDLTGALARFYMGVAATGNPDWTTKVEELRTALDQTPLDVGQILTLQNYFAGRPGAARLSRVFFAHPVLLDRLRAAFTPPGGDPP